MSKPIELYKFKIGEKFFYDNFTKIYTLLKCDYDLGNPDEISFIGRPLYGRHIETHTIKGQNVLYQTYYKYRHMDDGSFIAGFKKAIDLCKEHMTPQQINNINYLNHDIILFLEARAHLNGWKSQIINNGIRNEDF